MASASLDSCVHTRTSFVLNCRLPLGRGWILASVVVSLPTNMILSSALAICLCLAGVECFKITSKVGPSPGLEKREPIGRSLDLSYPDQTTYDAVYSGLKKPITIDCTQPGVVCKFPLVFDEIESSKPAKNVNEVTIVKGVEVTEDAKAEAREDLTEKEEVLEIMSQVKEDIKAPIFKGSLDVESVDFKNSEDSWLLEKRYHNKKYQIPVKLVPSVPHRDHGSAPVYPSRHDVHDHFSAGDPYYFATNHHSGGWTPWMRSYPAVYNYNHNNEPCQPPPVYHHPPPCSPVVTPTRRPVVNIDDKVDKDED